MKYFGRPTLNRQHRPPEFLFRLYLYYSVVRKLGASLLSYMYLLANSSGVRISIAEVSALR